MSNEKSTTTIPTRILSVRSGDAALRKRGPFLPFAALKILQHLIDLQGLKKTALSLE